MARAGNTAAKEGLSALDHAALIEGLRRLASVLAKKHDIQVIFAGNQASTSGRTIYVPELPVGASKELVQAIIGFLDHEVSHLIHTDMDWWNDNVEGWSPNLRFATNVVEDVRAEYRMTEEYAGCGVNLDYLHGWSMSRAISTGAWDQATDVSKILMLCKWRGQYYSNGDEAMGEWLDANSGKFAPIVAAVEDQVRGWHLLGSVQDAHAAAKTLLDTFQAMCEPPQEGGEPQESDEDSVQLPTDQQPEQQDGGEGEGEPQQEQNGQQGQQPQQPQDDEEQEQSKSSSGGEAQNDETDAEGEGTGEQPDNCAGDGDDADGTGSQDDEQEDGEDSGSDGSGADEDDEQAGENAGANEPEPASEDDSHDNGSDDDESADSDAEGAGDEGQGTEEEPEAADDGAGEEDDSAEGDGAAQGDDEGGANDGDDEEGVEQGGNSDGDEDGDADGASGDADSGTGAPGQDTLTKPAPTKVPKLDEETRKILEEVIETELSDEEADGNLEAEMIVKTNRHNVDIGKFTVYTTEFDITIDPPSVDQYTEVNYNELRDEVIPTVGAAFPILSRLLRARSLATKLPGRYSGKLDAQHLASVKTLNTAVFAKKIEGIRHDSYVSLVIDCSGSMSGNKQLMAAKVAIVLAEILERGRIPFDAVGFTDATFGNGQWQSLLDPAKRDALRHLMATPNFHDDLSRYHRTAPIVEFSFKSANQTLKQAMPALAAAQDPGYSWANADGDSLLRAAARMVKRKEKRRIMMVLSDGQPASSIGYNAPGARRGIDVHAKRLKQVVEAIGSMPDTEIVGIGIQDDAVTDYYPRSFVVHNLEQLPTLLVQDMARFLRQGMGLR